MDESLIDTPILKVADRAEKLVGSEIIKLAGEVREKISNGEKVFNYTIGDFDAELFQIPKALKQEIINAYKDDQTNYPAANGVEELRESISRFLHTRGLLEYNSSQILVAGGARPLIYAAYQTLLDPGDTVIYPVPSWNNNHYSHLAGAKGVSIETKAKNNFMPTAEQIKPHISKANLITLCSPLNPTGTTLSSEKLEAICDLILDENRKRGEMNKPVYLLYDQIYWQLNYDGAPHADPVTLRPEMKNYTLYIDGLSKAFAATGVRVGWAFGPQKVVNKMRSVLGHIGAWAPKAEQVACAKFLQDDEGMDDYLRNLRTGLKNRLDAFYNGFTQMREEGFNVDVIEPKAAMYLTVKLDLKGMETSDGHTLETTEDVTQYLLEVANIALVPFKAFGASKNSPWYRLSVGTVKEKEIDTFFNNLREALVHLS